MNDRKAFNFEMICFAMILLLNGLQISIPVPFTNSGVLTICGSEVVVMLLSVYLLCLLFKEKEKVRENKAILILCIIYSAYSVITYGYRIIFNAFEMKSILVIKADIFAFVILLVLLIRGLNIKKLYLIYSVIFAVIAVLLAPSWGKWAYWIYQNAAIRLMFLCIQYSVILGYRVCTKNRRDKRTLDLIRAVYIFSMLFCYVNILGGKANTVTIILCILCGEALIVIKEKKWNFRVILLPVLFAALSLAIIYPTSHGMFTRIFWENTVASDEIEEKKEYEVDDNGYIVNDQDRFAYYEKSASKDSLHARSEVWKAAWQDIKKNPIFGVGLCQYEVTYSTGNSAMILPHNFLLEYMQAVGIAGVLLMGLILLWGLISICKMRNTYLLICYFLLLLVSFMYAFVQPIFCNAAVVFIVFINIGIFVNLGKENQKINVSTEKQKERMRVLVVTCAHMVKTKEDEYYTTTVYDYDFFKRYLQVFDEVKVVARCQKSDKLDSGAMKVSGEKVLVHELPEFKGLSGLLKKFCVLKKLAENAAQESDCIVYRVPQMESYYIFFFNKYDLPYVVEVTSDPLHNKTVTGVLNKINVGLLKYMCKKADGASYVTEKYLQSLYPSGKSLKLSGNKFESFYSSIVLDDSMIGEVKKYGDIPVRPFVLVHVTNAIENPSKGHYTAIKVVEKLVKAGRNIQIKFIGEGKMTDDLKRTVEELGLQNNVIFTGRIANRQELLDEVRKSDLMLFPTKSEGLPRCIIEAQAVGLPVISTPVGGIPELVEEKYLRQPDDVEGFTELVSRLIDNPQELEEMSTKGLDNARKYTDSVLTARRSEFYAQLRERAESDRG